MPNDLIDTTEAGKRFTPHRSTHTVRKWIRDGKLKGVKVGRIWLVDGLDLERLVKEKECGRS
jgi:excisionase family DNA binding protein